MNYGNSPNYPGGSNQPKISRRVTIAAIAAIASQNIQFSSSVFVTYNPPRTYHFRLLRQPCPSKNIHSLQCGHCWDCS